ncbi:MAG: hypothetical protein DRP56_06620 [Planctomycetota bacterium]|nr:MAG: hypothetical protein DRP56_06620 [Planctomycetota bacterium]
MTEPASIWPIIATVAALFTGIVSGLVIYNLQSLKTVIATVQEKQKAQDAKIDKLVERKDTCNQHFVGKVDYIRSIHSMEKSNNQLLEKVCELTGMMEVVKQMPQIAAGVAREVTKEALRVKS